MKFSEKYAKWIFSFVFGVALIAVYKTFDNLTYIFSWFGRVVEAFGQVILGFIIAYVLNIPIKRVNKRIKKLKNKFVSIHSLGISITLVYIVTFAAVSATLSVVIPQLMMSIRDLYFNHETYVDQAINYINSFEIIKNSGLVNEALIYEKIESFLANIDISTVSHYAAGVYNFTYGILQTVIAVIISIYMLFERERVSESVKHFLLMFAKRDTAEWLIKETRRVNNIFTGYLYTRCMCSVVLAIITVPVLYVLRVRYALVLGVFLGACDMIPYFGSIFGSILLVVVNILTGGDIWQTFWLAIILVVLQQIDGNVIAPRITSSRLELRPLTIVCAIIVGGNLFGPMGMILAVPLVAVLKEIFIDIFEARSRRLGIDTDINITEEAAGRKNE